MEGGLNDSTKQNSAVSFKNQGKGGIHKALKEAWKHGINKNNTETLFVSFPPQELQLRLLILFFFLFFFSDSTATCRGLPLSYS